MFRDFKSGRASATRRRRKEPCAIPTSSVTTLVTGRQLDWIQAQNTSVSSFRTPGLERPAIHRHERHQRHGMHQHFMLK
jgi:hypothetical protein